MTHEEKLQLARVKGTLDFALSWAEIARKIGNDMLATETDAYARGLAWGEVAVAEDAIRSLEKIRDLLEPLWKGGVHELR